MAHTIPGQHAPDALVQAALSLEPLPPTLTRLAELVADERTQLRQIAEVVSLDPLLAGTLLRRANVALSAPSRPVATVPEAVVRLGMGMVLSLSVCSHVVRLTRTGGRDRAAGTQLWKHSVATSIAADLLRGRAAATRSIPAETSTAALLHDLGRLVADRFLPAEVVRELQRTRHMDGRNRLQAEVGSIGLHHAELGARIVEHWRLPGSIALAVRHHHTPEESGDRIAYALCAADQLAHQVVPEEAGGVADALTQQGDENDEALLARCLRELGIEPSRRRELVSELTARYERTRALFEPV